MSEQRENHELWGVLLFLLATLFLILGVEYLIFNGLLNLSGRLIDSLTYKVYTKTHPISFGIRVFYVVVAMGVFYVKNPTLVHKEKGKKKRLFIGSVLIIFFLFGFSTNEFYNLVVYPILLPAIIYAAYLIRSVIGPNFNDENIFGVSQEKPRQVLSYSYEVEGDKSPLIVHSAEQHIYVSGGTGAGKSDSILKPTLYQHVFFDKPACIYDFKGNPMTLGKTAYTAYIHAAQQKKELRTALKFFNFNDVTRSFRINPLTPKYLSSVSDTNKLVAVLLKNFNPEWRRQEDVWYRGARAIWSSLITRFLNDEELKHKLCFPLLLELLSTDRPSALLNFIEDNAIARKVIAPVLLAKTGAMKQFTGYFTSANDIVSHFIGNKELYWLMSEDEIDLDINNPKNPTFLCLASDGVGDSEYSPLMASIIAIIMRYLGEQGKLPTLFQLDEIYTIYLDKLPGQANTFRSMGVCLQIGNQLNSMLVDMYGKEKAQNIIGACGTQFFGMGNENETGKVVVDMLSDIDRYSQSLTTSESSQSLGESLKRQKAVEIRDVVNQPTGHFMGKIANGNPTFFNLQFKPFKHRKEELEVPPFVLDAYTKEELHEAMETNYEAICTLTQELLDAYDTGEKITANERAYE